MEINKKKTSIENKEEIRKNINAKRIMMFLNTTKCSLKVQELLLKEHQKT